MSIANLFEKIAGRQKQREKSRIDDFRGLVRAIANGQEPDADRVDAVLFESGKSLDDLRTSVEQLQKRIEMRAMLDTMPKLDAEQAELEAKIGKATEIFNAAERKYDETVNPLRWRLDQIKSDSRYGKCAVSTSKLDNIAAIADAFESLKYATRVEERLPIGVVRHPAFTPFHGYDSSSLRGCL